MAATLLGEAAVRIVPSMRGFRTRVQSELAAQKGLKVDVDIRPRVDTSTAQRQLERFRAKEQADAIELKARIDEAEFRRSFQRVEHVFQRSAFAKALRLQVKVIGADALYTLAAAAGAAAASLDVVAKSALILPGALASAGVAAGVFAVALSGVKKAFTAVQTEQDQAADKARALAGAQADSAKAHRDVARAAEGISTAVRDATRNLEDLTRAARRTSLNEAGALLNVQESYERLAAGGQKSLTELKRDQLSYLESLADLDDVRTQNKRTLEDYNDAQRRGVAGSDQVVTALDAVADAQNRVADAASRMADATQTKTSTGAFARLAPSAQEFVRAFTDAEGAWTKFTGSIQETAFRGQAANFLDTLNVSASNFGPKLVGVAEQINGVFKDLGETLRRQENQGFLSGIVGNTSATLAELRRGIDPLVTGLLRLSSEGGQHLPQLADVFNRLFDRFDAWTAKIASDGSLDNWIRDGIRSFESLIRTGENIVGIVNNVAHAWRLAGGEQDGLISNAEELTRRIREWSGGAGTNDLVQNFKQMREWIAQVWQSLKDIWPTVQSLAETTRLWSQMFFNVLGIVAKVTNAIEQHTGLVGHLLLLYLSFRTIRPVWDLLVGGVKLYEAAMTRMALQGSGWAQKSVRDLGQVQTAFGRTGTQAQTAATLFGTSTSKMQASVRNLVGPTNDLSGQFNLLKPRIDDVGRSFAAPLTPANNLTTAFRNANPQVRELNTHVANAVSPLHNMGNAAAGAGTKVGGGGGSLLAGAKSLVGYIGRAGLFTAAIAGTMFAIDKLGDAHKKAGDAAEKQKTQLDSLKASLDNVTGAVTPAAAAQAGQEAQKFPTGFGERNVIQDIQRAGLGTPQQLLQAINPTQQGVRTDLLSRTDEAMKQKIESSDVWREFGGKWQEHGIDSLTLARAVRDDEEALGKLRNAEQEMMKSSGIGGVGKTGTHIDQQVARRAGALTPTATDVIERAGLHDLASTGLFVTTRERGLRTQGQQTQTGQAAAFGNRQLNAAGANIFGQGSPVTSAGRDSASVVVNPDKLPPNWAQWVQDQGFGSAKELPDKRIQVDLTPEATRRFTEGFAQGGIIRGSGSGTSDSNLIRASRGEFIFNKRAVSRVGVNNLDRVNRGVPGFASGGEIKKPTILERAANIAAATRPAPKPAPAGMASGVPLLPGASSTAAPTTPSPLDPLLGRGPVPGSGPVPRPGFGPMLLPNRSFRVFPQEPPRTDNWVQAGLRNVGNFFLSATGIGKPPSGYGETRTATVTLNEPHASVPAPKPPVGPSGVTQFADMLGLGSVPKPSATPVGGPGLPGGVTRSPTGNWIGPPNSVVNVDGQPIQFGADGLPAKILPKGTPPAAAPGSVVQQPITGAAGPALPPPSGTTVGPGVPVGTGPAPGPADESLTSGGTTSTTVPQVPSYNTAPVDPSSTSLSAGSTPLYTVTPNAAGSYNVQPSGPVLSQMKNLVNTMVGTPYVWGGNSLAGTDCSGLAAMLANIAVGRDPLSGRFGTATEQAELTSRGFRPGKGGPGTLTIGWNASHTAITLPDGTPVSSGEDGGVKVGGGGSEQHQFTNWMHLPVDQGFLNNLGVPGTSMAIPGVVPGLPGQTPGTSTQADPTQAFLSGLTGVSPGSGAFNPLDPQKFQEFLNSQMQNIGSALQSAGLAFVQGLTGVDFSGLVGAAGQLGGHFAGQNGQTSSDTEAYSGLQTDVSSLLTQFPQVPLNVGNGKGNVKERYGRLVTEICQQMGVDPQKWAPALLKQIETESGGDPVSINPNDNNGRGGKQTVMGLFNFLPSTFEAYKVQGFGSGQINDPISQIAAAINYTRRKHGVGEDGTPNQIGRGVGFASGGLIGVSRGEYRMSAKGVNRLGLANAYALNAGGLIPGFQAGGYPWPQYQTGVPPGPGVPAPTSGPGVPPDTRGNVAGVSGPPPASGAGIGAQLSGGITSGISTTLSDAASGVASAAVPGAGLALSAPQFAGSAISAAMGLASAIGSGTIGTQPNAGGKPLLPQRQASTFGQLPSQQQMSGQPQPGGMGPTIQNNYYGGIHTSNIDEWGRRQERLRAQQEQPLTNTFVHP